MNHSRFRVSEPPYETALIDGIAFARDLDGVWRYADSWIPVPGARDVTLTARFQPKLIVSNEQEIERVIVSAEDIAAAPELLDWCLVDGTPVTQGDELIEVLVPYELWRERDRIPGELISPEHEGSEAEQQVAAAEREFREAERQLEKAADYRAEVLRRHADEMTRQEARAITGLSVGRIQQLIRADRLEEHEIEILRLFESGPIKSFVKFAKAARQKGLPPDDEILRDAITDLENRGLLEAEAGKGVRLTREGADALFSAQIANSRAEAGEA